MGLYADYIAHSILIDKTEPQVGPQRVTYNELLRHQARLDQTMPTVFTAKDEVQIIGKFTGTVNGGNFTITIVDELGVDHVTANILYNANAATIEGAIDTKMTADSYPSWVNGHINVALTGDLTANAATVTYDGASVTTKNFGQLIATDKDLAGGGTIGTQSTTTHGQTIRYVWAVMWAHGMVSTPPPQGTLLSPATLSTTPASTTAHWPSGSLRKLLAWEAAIDDNLPSLRTQLETLFKV